MSQIRKLDVTTEIKCSVDKFYGTIRNNMAELVKIFPQIYKSIELIEGDGTVGSITLWKYFLGGQNFIAAKERIVGMDDENRLIAFQKKKNRLIAVKVIEGDLLNNFKSVAFTVQVTNNSGGGDGDGDGGLVKWCMEYEEANNDAPVPNAYMDLFDKITKGLDAHLLAKP